MQAGDEDKEAPGVYLLDPDDKWRLIHEDRGGDYHLHDIKEAFALGTRATPEVVERFLARTEQYRTKLSSLNVCGNEEAVDRIEEMVAEQTVHAVPVTG